MCVCVCVCVLGKSGTDFYVDDTEQSHVSESFLSTDGGESSCTEETAKKL